LSTVSVLTGNLKVSFFVEQGKIENQETTPRSRIVNQKKKKNLDPLMTSSAVEPVYKGPVLSGHPLLSGRSYKR